MSNPRPGTDVLTFASLLVVLATTVLASLRIASDPESLDPRLLGWSFVGLSFIAIVMVGDARRMRLLLPAAPVLIVVGMLHLVLACAVLQGSAAASAGIGGAAELLVGVGLLPSLLTSVLAEPKLRERLRSSGERLAAVEQETGGLEEELDQADGRLEDMRRLAIAWERHARAAETRAARLGQRAARLLESVRPEDNVLVVPGAAPLQLRRFLLELAQQFGWTRVTAIAEAVRLAVGEGQVVYVDGAEDPLAECVFLQAISETSTGFDAGAATRVQGDEDHPRWERMDRGPTTRVIDELVAASNDPAAALRTVRPGLDLAGTTLPTGEDAVA